MVIKCHKSNNGKKILTDMECSAAEAGHNYEGYCSHSSAYYAYSWFVSNVTTKQN